MKKDSLVITMLLTFFVLILSWGRAMGESYNISKVATIKDPEHSLQDPVLSNSGNYVALRDSYSKGNRGYGVWSLGTGKNLYYSNSDYTDLTITFSPDDRLFAMYGEIRHGAAILTIFDLQTNKELSQYEFPRLEINGSKGGYGYKPGWRNTIIFSPDKKYLFVSGKFWSRSPLGLFGGDDYDASGFFSVFLVENGQKIFEKREGFSETVRYSVNEFSINNISFSPDGKYFTILSVKNGDSLGSLSLWEMGAWKKIRTIENTSLTSPQEVHFSADSSQMALKYTVNKRDTYRIYNIAGELLKETSDFADPSLAKFGYKSKPDALKDYNFSVYSSNYKYGLKYLSYNNVEIWKIALLSEEVQQYVQTEFEKWQRKGEYEKTVDYARRMQGQLERIRELLDAAFTSLGIWQRATINQYDPDSESYKISIPAIGDIIMPVPVSSAKSFRDNWEKMQFRPEFSLKDNGWVLSRLNIADSDVRSYIYDSKNQPDYNSVAFNIPTPQVNMHLSSTILKTEVRKVNLKPSEDVNIIPEFKSKARENDVAIVIGIENYKDLPKSAFSKSDAGLMKDYLKALGFRERNMEFITDGDASKSRIEKAVEGWLPNRVKRDSAVFIYYSGHGAPDPKSGEGYLVPFDGDPGYLANTGYSLKRLTEALGRLEAREVVIILDSCFSGAGGRSVLAKNARPIVLRNEGLILKENMVLISATQADQISTSSSEKGHGVFTYYFLKALKDGKKNLAEIFEYVKPQVEDEAKTLNVEQSPNINPSAELIKGRFGLVK